ncbi:MAG: gamma carbonic anhydrase family protein [Desulfobacteraceae bacterium]|nr:MAG: gamma carbonic anhydrase family protein [Desulfobacteraceae bacterium]
MTCYAFKDDKPRIHESVFTAPTAQIIGNVSIGAESSVWFQTVIRGDMEKITIGEQTNIQDLCMCHADEGIPLNVGNRVTVGHRCIIHGCTIEDGCLIGMGAVIMNRASIGRGSVIAAGSVILEGSQIPPYSLVAGSPGRIKKTYRKREEIEASIREMSEIYMENARAFQSDTFYKITD